eukprot:2398156-Prymnesium_polylepis.2
MGIHCDTKLFSGPRAVVAYEWSAHKAEMLEDEGEGEADEDEEEDEETKEYRQWQGACPPALATRVR